MIKSHFLRLSTMACLLALLTAPSHRAFANPTRVTQGDAQAVLHAYTTGGGAIIMHRGIVEGGPADGRTGSRAAIRPLPFFNGRHYCAEDWHVILISAFEGGDLSFTYHDAVELLSPITIEFTLDGQALSTERQSIRRVLYAESFGLEELYGFSQGTVLSPDDMSPGPHTLTVETFRRGITRVFSITFHIDASGTGTCVQ